MARAGYVVIAVDHPGNNIMDAMTTRRDAALDRARSTLSSRAPKTTLIGPHWIRRASVPLDFRPADTRRLSRRAPGPMPIPITT